MAIICTYRKHAKLWIELLNGFGYNVGIIVGFVICSAVL